MKISAVDKSAGKSESITITNEKGRLSPEDVEGTGIVVEKVAAEYGIQRKRTEVRNSPSLFIH